MPSLPTAPLMNLVEQAFATIAPGQAAVLAGRVSAWRNASSPQSGVMAVLATAGQRITSSTAHQVYPKGVRNYQVYPTGISVH